MDIPPQVETPAYQALQFVFHFISMVCWLPLLMNGTWTIDTGELELSETHLYTSCINVHITLNSVNGWTGPFTTKDLMSQDFEFGIHVHILIKKRIRWKCTQSIHTVNFVILLAQIWKSCSCTPDWRGKLLQNIDFQNSFETQVWLKHGRREMSRAYTIFVHIN